MSFNSSKREINLPLLNRRNILITSALPYINATPHLGNLIGCVLSADVFAKFSRIRGHNVLYVSGTDEYGTATEMAALKEGISPQQICDKYHKIHKDIYEQFDIDFDIFGRTSTKNQTKIVSDIFKKLENNGFIEEKQTEQLYCYTCKTPLADRFIIGKCPICCQTDARGDQCDSCGSTYDSLIDPKCKSCGNIPVSQKTNHLYLKLSSLKNKLKQQFDNTHEKNNWSQNSVSVTQSQIEKLDDRSITRSLKQGTLVPKKGYEDKVFYVWFDATIGYISITSCATNEQKQQQMPDDEENKNVELYQFMGKDNIPFHTVVFPSTLLGTKNNQTLLKHINTTEYLLYEGGKFSKSKKIGVFGDDAKDTSIPSEIWRYYLLVNRPETSDSDFHWDDLAAKSNGELLNNLGNFVHRVITFVENKFNREIPQIKVYSNEDKEFLNVIGELTQTYIEELESVKIKVAIRTVLAISDKANTYYQRNQPWKLIKSLENTDLDSCSTVIGICCHIVNLLAILVYPYMPTISNRIAKQLNIDQNEFKLPDFSKDNVLSIIPTFKQNDKNHKIGTPEILFQKIQKSTIEELKKKFSGTNKDQKNDIVFPLDLAVGTVIEVSDHPSADHLQVLKVTLGGSPIQIVSGLKKFYTEKEILQKSVVCIINIKSSKFQGVSSKAMILCAKDKENDSVTLIRSNQPNGSRIIPSNNIPVNVKKNFNYKKNWSSLNLKTNEASEPVFNNILLECNKEALYLEKKLPNSDLV